MKTAPVLSQVPRECGYLLLAAVGAFSLASKALEVVGWLVSRLTL